MYLVEVPKMVGSYWFLVPVNALRKVECSRDWSLPRGAGVQYNLEGIHAISRLMCEIWWKILGGFLSLRLALV